MVGSVPPNNTFNRTSVPLARALGRPTLCCAAVGSVNHCKR